jgi:hypothetical protein
VKGVHIYSVEYKILRIPLQGVHREKNYSSVERFSTKTSARSAQEDFPKIFKFPKKCKACAEVLNHFE